MTQDALTAPLLESRLRELIEAACVARLRGLDLMAKIYDDEFERLFLEWEAALAEARNDFQRRYGVVYHLPAGRDYSGYF